MFGDPPTLDPYKSLTLLVQTNTSFVYSRLLNFKSETDPARYGTYDLQPDLAESFERSPDGTTYTFKLRQGVTFHNGKPFDSEDVVQSFRRFRELPHASVSSLAIVDTVQAPDARTVVFKIKEPYAPFIYLIASPFYMWILPRDIVAGSIDPTKTMVGTGPFQFVSYEPGVAVRFKKNPSYYLQGRPYLDEVVLNVVKDVEQRKAQLIAGNLHMAGPGSGIPLPDADAVKQGRPTVRTVPLPIDAGNYIGFQALRPDSPYYDPKSPFNKDAVRIAASRAIDRDALNKVMFGGRGVTPNVLPYGFTKWHVDIKSPALGDAGKNFEFSIPEAKRLLTEAGYPNGFDTKMHSAANTVVIAQLPELLANMLTQAGIRVQQVLEDYPSQYLPNTFQKGQFDGLWFGADGNFPEVDMFLYTNFHSKSSLRNHSNVADPEMDRLIDAQRRETDEAKRKQLIADIQKLNAQKMYVVPTAGAASQQILQPEVQGYAYGSGYGSGTETFAHIWLKPS